VQICREHSITLIAQPRVDATQRATVREIRPAARSAQVQMMRVSSFGHQHEQVQAPLLSAQVNGFPKITSPLGLVLEVVGADENLELGRLWRARATWARASDILAKVTNKEERHSAGRLAQAPVAESRAVDSELTGCGSMFRTSFGAVTTHAGHRPSASGRICA
jgi:hypothetical protein